MEIVRNLLPIVPKYLRIRRSQYASTSTIEAESHRRLEDTLRAAAEISFYRERLDAPTNAMELRKFPILERTDIPALNRSVRARIGPGVSFFCDNSSGSTGMPVEFLFDSAHQTGRYAARIRYLRASGWSPLRRNVWIVAFTSGPDENADSQLAFSRLRMRSTFLRLIFRPFEEQIDALLPLNPEFLYTMPSNLDGLLRVFEERGVKLPALRCIFSGGEVLEDSIRERARRLLGVEIRDNYGSAEGFIAWQCPRGSYHLNTEHVLIEIVDQGGAPAAPGQMGRLLMTTLENRLMPLIRYEIGDYAIASDEACACGRTLPLIGKVIGRGINLFRMPDGRLVSPWPLIGPLKARPELRQFQIVQDEADHFVLRFVSEHDLDAAAQSQIADRFCEILGMRAALKFERMDSIPRTAGAKFMIALSMLHD